MSDYFVGQSGGMFVLPLQGFVCSEMRGNDLILRSPHSADEAWLSGSSMQEDDLAEGLVRREARVERAAASRDSKLRVDFDGGVSVVNPPADDGEAWEVRGPGHVVVVALPGGGEPAVWDAASEICAVHPGDPLPPALASMIEAFGFPTPTGEFELRCTSAGTESFELHPPNSPPVNRSQIVRFVDTG